MKVYHASTVKITSPDTKHSRDYLDFGKGFYLTTIEEQARKYAERFLRRNQQAWLNIYELSDELSNWNIKTFEHYDKEWLEFIAACRAGLPTIEYDMIIGGIADDKVIRTLDRFFAKEINEEEALKRLIYEKPNIQYCIRSEQMLCECITFLESKRL